MGFPLYVTCCFSLAAFNILSLCLVYVSLMEKAIAPHSSTLACKIPWTEEPGRLQSMGLQRVRHDWVTSMCLSKYVSWHVSPWVYTVRDPLHLLNLIDSFLFHIEEIFNYNLFKIFLIPFLFLFFFWDPFTSHVVAFDTVPEDSETILSSFHSFYFILIFRSYFHHVIFQLTDSFFCFRYSAVDSS